MNSPLQELIKELHQAGEYRPVNVTIIYRKVNAKIEFLLTQPRNAPEIWSFPQGGINLEETIEESLARELREELGIDSRKDLAEVIYAIHYQKLDFEQTRENRRGFTKGKAYIFSLAQYIGDGSLIFTDGEVINIAWKDYDSTFELLSTARQEKLELSKIAIDRARWILS